MAAEKFKQLKRRARPCAFFVALAALSFFASTPQATAEPEVSAHELAQYQAADENMRVQMLFKLLQAGFINAAGMLVHRYPLQGPYAANRTLFIEGEIAEKQGHHTEAAAKFRAALASDPHLTLVRSELAKVLVELDENDSAKHHLELLAADTHDPQQLAGIRSFEQSLNERHPLTFSGFVSVAPSTNINQGSSHSTVYSPGIAGMNGVSGVGTIAPFSQQQSGIGLTAGGSVGFAHHIGDHWQAVLAANAAVTYFPAIQAASLGTSQSAELRYLFDGGYLGAGAIASQSSDPINMSLGYTSYGPRVSLSKLLTPRDQLSASASYEWRNYAGNSALNGNALTVSAVMTHAIDSTSNVALILGYENVTQQMAFNSYQDVTGGLGFYKELPRGITLEGQGTARLAGFDDVNPFTLSTRQDTNLTGSMTLTKRDWNWFGFAPSLNYTYVRNFSNIAVYDYDSHAVDFRLTKNF